MENGVRSHFGSMKATQARSTIRKALKAHVSIKYGKSNPALERMTTSCARKIMGLYTEDDRVAWHKLPDWLTEEALEFFSWPLRGLMGDDRPRIVRPDCVPEIAVVAAPARKVVYSRGFDLFCWLEKEKCNAIVAKLTATKKWGAKSRSQLLKVAGSRLWHKLTLDDKKVFVARADAKKNTRERGDDGKFHRAVADAEVAEVDAMLDAIAPEAEKADEPVAEEGAVAAAAVAEEAEPEAPQTPPRKRTRAQKESALASSLLQVVSDSLVTPAKAEMENTDES